PDRAELSAICTITGCVAGRPLAAKSFPSPSELRASAPSPYTVSVGKATRRPARSACAASAMASGVAGTITVDLTDRMGKQPTGQEDLVEFQPFHPPAGP